MESQTPASAKNDARLPRWALIAAAALLVALLVALAVTLTLLLTRGSASHTPAAKPKPTPAKTSTPPLPKLTAPLSAAQARELAARSKTPALWLGPEAHGQLRANKLAGKGALQLDYLEGVQLQNFKPGKPTFTYLLSTGPASAKDIAGLEANAPRNTRFLDLPGGLTAMLPPAGTPQATFLIVSVRDQVGARVTLSQAVSSTKALDELAARVSVLRP